MKVAGIIAEYNPFHLGHQRQIEYIKKECNADYIIAVMSGDYVQRGAPALLPKHVRTEMALLGGVDLVLELPVSVSTASAEFFAKGAVSLLDGIGAVNMLCFGSEAGCMKYFEKTAEILYKEPLEYQKLLKDNLKTGKNFPTARQEALVSYLNNVSDFPVPEDFRHFLSSPNNILGLEYCKAILEQKSSIQPVTLLRKGNGYHDIQLLKGKSPSASAVRTFLRETVSTASVQSLADRLAENLAPYLPDEICKLLIREASGNGFITEEDFDLLVHCCLLSLSMDDMCLCMDVSQELAARIRNSLNQYRSISQFTSLLKTREITYTRIQRSLLHLLLRIRKPALPVPYARILGFQKASSPLLKEIKRCSRLPVITKLSKGETILNMEGKRVLEENIFASNLYEAVLCKKQNRSFVHECQKPVIII